MFDEKGIDMVDVKLVLIISGKDRSISDVTEFFRTWKRDQPVWQNNTEIKFDLIDVRSKNVSCKKPESISRAKQIVSLLRGGIDEVQRYNLTVELFRIIEDIPNG